MLIAPIRYFLWYGIVFFIIGCSVEQTESGSQTANQDSISVDLTSEPQTDTSATRTETSDRIASIQDRLVPIESTDSEQSDTPKYRLEVPPYSTFLNEEGYLDLLGRSMAEIDEVLGESPIVARQSIRGAPIRKEIRVYLPYEEDSTGLYIFFENERVIEFKMDEFNGIIQSGILDYLK